MASDIWQRFEVKGESDFTKFRQLLWPIVFISWFAIIFLTPYVESQVQNAHGPSSDFSTHTLVRPRVFHARNKREIIDTRINNSQHVNDLTINLQIDGIQLTLDLQLNTDLVPVGYKQTYQYKGNFTTEMPEKIELCHYQGSIRGIPNSWIALSTCRGLHGVIYDSKNMHYIHSLENSLNTTHYLYKDSDLLIFNKTCGTKSTSQHNIIPPKSKSRTKRTTNQLIRGPYNSNDGSRYVELVLVVDTEIYNNLGRNIDEVYHHCKNLANIINAFYTPLNIFIALVGVEVWTDRDEITISYNSTATLSNFLEYRRQKLTNRIPNDNAQLLTLRRFGDGIVGKAGVGAICTYLSSGGVNTDHSPVIGFVAATVAHEMGHNFGMSHDVEYCECPEDSCIMGSALTSTAPTHWSSCSLEQLSLAFSHGMDYCLRNKPKKLFNGPVCGNGFVEPGEQCDCGLKDYCDNACCDAANCKLHSNASCATGECCDLSTCKLMNRGRQCRSAKHECDLPEYCTGSSEYCPEDVYKIDGEVCKKGKAFCYQGACKTHDDQCKLLWGPSGISSELSCYKLNEKGFQLGNCGYNQWRLEYLACNKEDILCGRLQCHPLSGIDPQFGVQSAVKTSHSYEWHGSHVVSCKSVVVDLGVNDDDPGMVPNGAKCADGKMCVNQRCVSVAYYTSMLKRDSYCLGNCSGNGVCNGLGHCHCDRGFRPPDCILPGFGGSDDSGPTDDPNDETSGVATALYIIFLGIIPIIGLILFIIWYKRNKSTSIIGNEMFLSTYQSIIKYFQRMKGSSQVTNDEPPKVFTIGNQLRKNEIQVTERSFVSTTNPEAIKYSRNIRNDRSPSSDDTNKNTPNVILSNKQYQRPMRPSNELRVNTRLKPQQPEEIPFCSTSGTPLSSPSYDSDCVYESNSEIYLGFKKLSAIRDDTPKNATEIADNQSQTVSGKFFYAKKPPPPPRPPPVL